MNDMNEELVPAVPSGCRAHAQAILNIANEKIRNHIQLRKASEAHASVLHNTINDVLFAGSKVKVKTSAGIPKDPKKIQTEKDKHKALALTKMRAVFDASFGRGKDGEPVDAESAMRQHREMQVGIKKPTTVKKTKPASRPLSKGLVAALRALQLRRGTTQ